MPDIACVMLFSFSSSPTMETQTENQRPNNGQLIYVPHKDTIRLLEVYVKRSISLNDGTLKDTKVRRKEKWVTMPRKQRRHSSDPSLHLAEGFNYEEIGTFSGVETPANQPKELNVLNEKSEKPTKKSKKSKKPSFWKNVFGIFYRKSNEDKDEDEDSPSEIPEGSQGEELFDSATTCLPTTPVPLQKRKSMRRKSIKRRFSKRRLSSIKHNKSIKELNPADITRVEGKIESCTCLIQYSNVCNQKNNGNVGHITFFTCTNCQSFCFAAAVSVEATYSYYEKVSQELERIVQEVQVKEEVKPLSDGEKLFLFPFLTLGVMKE